MGWDASTYLAFGEERLRPALDLIRHIPLSSPASIIDLGCGPGTVTRLLAERWPEAMLTGVDSSPTMLARARELLPAVRWIEADLFDHTPDAPCDLVFSNAALHWLTNHRRLFLRLRTWVAPGGVLAVQVPDNFGAPSHRLIREVASSAEFASAIGDARMGAVLAPADYQEILSAAGGDVRVWSTEYLQVLHGDQPVLNWLRGTTLVPYLGALGRLADPYLAQLAPRLDEAYPRRADGSTMFPFRRLFMIARF